MFDFDRNTADQSGTPPKENAIPFSGGEVVRHPLFGVGRILEVSGSNEKASVKVSFNAGGTKHLLLAYAKLERLE